MHHARGLESVTCNCINDALRGVVFTRLFFCIRLTLRHCLLLEPQHDFLKLMREAAMIISGIIVM